MARRIKKILLVIILTVLIWAWAYQASDKSIDKPAVLTVSRAIDPSLFVTFEGKDKVDFRITITGPALQVSELEKKLAKGEEQLEFVFNAEEEKMVTSGTHSLNLLQFLKTSDKMTALNLAAESCSPAKISVVVEKLVDKTLPVHCYNDNGLPVEHEKITPPTVKMFVPEKWTGDLLEARVLLTSQSVESARKAPITIQPYVELIPGVPTYANQSVQIKLPSTQTLLEERSLPGSQLAIGYIHSPLTSKYDVVLSNEKELTEVTRFKATEAAFNAYKNQTYQMLIELKDSDINAEGEITRPVIYNFPAEFVAKNQIELASQPTPARFKLVKQNTTPPQN